MAIIQEKWTFKADVETLWSLITEIKFEGEFEVKSKEENVKYEFHTKDENVSGEWLFAFSEGEKGGTVVDIVATVEGATKAKDIFAKENCHTQMKQIKEFLYGTLEEVDENDNGQDPNLYSGFNNMSIGVVFGAFVGLILGNVPLGVVVGVIGALIFTKVKNK